MISLIKVNPFNFYLYKSKDKMGNAQSQSPWVKCLCSIGDEIQSEEESTGLLRSKERKFWMKNLITQGLPEKAFWEKNRGVQHPSFQQIAKDIRRSFSSTEFFQDHYNMYRFETLLKKFSLYFPKLGYTQGLNFIAGYILLAGFKDEEAFQVLVNLALNDKLLLIGLYEDSFPLARVYCSLFWNLLDKRLPRTAMKIKKSAVPDETWIFQWFISMFLYSFPVNFIKRFMDYVICKKQCSMVTLAIGIVYCLKQDIYGMDDPDQFQFFSFFDKLKEMKYCEKKIDIEKVISYANSITRMEINEGLQQCKIKNNIYYVYLLKEDQRKEIWSSVIDKLARERKMFRLDPKSKQYQRDKNMVRHLQRFLKKKSKLYFSKVESRVSSQLRTSNFTIQMQEQDPSTKMSSDLNSPLCNPFAKCSPALFCHSQNQSNQFYFQK